MILERKGFFLVGEWKREAEEISKGQMILLTKLASLPNFKVLVITGHSDNEQTEVTAINKLEYNGTLIPIGKSVDDLKSLVSAWLNYVERKSNEYTKSGDW